MRALTRDAEIREVEQLDPHFRRIRLGGEQLRGVSWSPGDKLQIRTKGLAFRTYTPINWIDETTEILAYIHGPGPGSELTGGWSTGDRCQIFGPRGSLKLATIKNRPILVGDETSFGLAAAWRAFAPDRPATHLFEASHEVSGLLAAVGIERARVARVQGHGATELDAWVCEAVAADPTAPLVMTGCAQTIKRLRRALKERGLHPSTALTKAYWDENRAGLD